MKKKKNTRLTVNVSDILISITCLFGMVFFFTMFWKDLNISFTRTDEKPIAVIYFKKNTAQRKLVNGNIWERLRTASPVFNGDKIRTASMSEAYAVFNDCTKIDLHENTLIQVFDNSNGKSVTFVSGSISILSDDADNRDFKINAGEKIFSFDKGTSAVISKSSSDVDKITIAVTSGEVLLEGEHDKNSTLVTAGNSAEIDFSLKDNNVTSNISGFKVTAPSTTCSVTLKKEDNVFIPFFWSGCKDIQLDFAADSSFEDIIQTKRLSSSSGKSSVSIDFAKNNEVVYWRALPISEGLKIEKKDMVPQGVIFLNQPDEIDMSQSIEAVFDDMASEMEEKIISNQQKAEDSFFNLFTEPDSTVVSDETITAELVDMKDYIEVSVMPETSTEEENSVLEELSLSKDQKTAKIETVTPDFSVDFDESGLKTEVSEPVIENTIVKNEEPTESIPDVVIPELVNATVILQTPDENASFTEKDFMVDEPSILFSWEIVSDAQNYLFVLYDSNGKKILEELIEDNNYSLKDDRLAMLDNGEYIWKIAAQTNIDDVLYSSKETSRAFVINIGDIETSEVEIKNLLQ